MGKTLLVTSCRSSEVKVTSSWIRKNADCLRAKDHAVDIALLVSERDALSEDIERLLENMGIGIIRDRDYCSVDHRPRIERVFEEVRSRSDLTSVVITNSDLHWGEVFKGQLSNVLSSTSFGMVCWHRLERCNGQTKGNYMYGIDVVAISTLTMTSRKIDQFFRFGRVGWDYAVVLANGFVEQDYHRAADLVHECHESGHSRQEWSGCIAELLEYIDTIEAEGLKRLLKRIASMGYYPAKVIFTTVIAKRMRDYGWELGNKPIEIHRA